MSFMLPHLHTAYAVLLRFGHDDNASCMRMDQLLSKIAEDVKAYCAIYLIDIDEVPEFNQMYELTDEMSIMFFYRNKHIQVDFSTGNNNKLNFVLNSKEELIDIIETVYRGARKGRGIVTSPRDYSAMRQF